MSAPRERSRVAFVDWLRLVAALQMISGHTLDAVLADELRTGAIYGLWVQLRGLTAPAFLVASGISFALASKLDDDGAYRALRARDGARLRRVVRSAWLVVLGTLLHALDAPWIVDVLHCIGATLLGLDLLVTLLPRSRQVGLASLMIGAALVALAAPIDHAIGAEAHAGPARLVLAWLDHDGGSLFPLVPWAAYVFLGVAIARVALPEGARTPSRTSAARLAAIALSALLLARGLEVAGAWGIVPAATASDWSSHPAVVLERLGLVLLTASLLSVVAARARLPAALTALAGETLALYVVHLLVLYAAGVGPAELFPHALGLGPSMALAAGMLALSVAVALAWGRLWPPIEARLLPRLAARGARRDPSIQAGRQGAASPGAGSSEPTRLGTATRSPSRTAITSPSNSARASSMKGRVEP